MDENNNALQMTDAVLFCYWPSRSVFVYLRIGFFAKIQESLSARQKQHRFLVLFVVLRNGKEVIESINHFLDTQIYPKDKYDIAVAATQLPKKIW